MRRGSLRSRQPADQRRVPVAAEARVCINLAEESSIRSGHSADGQCFQSLRDHLQQLGYRWRRAPAVASQPTSAGFPAAAGARQSAKAQADTIEAQSALGASWQELPQMIASPLSD